MRKSLLLAAAAAILFVPPSAAAEKASAGWSLAGSLGASVNPLGVENSVRVYRTFPLFPGRTGPLWDSARLEAGFHNSLTPASDTFSVYARIEPVAVVDLHLSAGIRGYYDLFGFGYTPLAGYDAPFDSDTRRDIERSEEAGFRYSATPTIKGALGPVFFSSSTSFVLFDMRGAGPPEDYYFEPVSHGVLKKFGGYLSSDTFLLYDFGRGILGGLAHSYIYFPGSSSVTQRIAAAGHAEIPAGRSMTFSASILGGVFLRHRYYSYRDGKVWFAVQAGMMVKL